MERLFVCGNGHSFKAFDYGVESEYFAEVAFGIPCPQCGAITLISWPSNRPFKVEDTVD